MAWDTVFLTSWEPFVETVTAALKFGPFIPTGNQIRMGLRYSLARYPTSTKGLIWIMGFR